jgi:hypothetical protein
MLNLLFPSLLYPNSLSLGYILFPPRAPRDLDFLKVLGFTPFYFTEESFNEMEYAVCLLGVVDA